LLQSTQDYEIEDIVDFLKEEFDRIITQYPFQFEGTILSDAQAFEIWFLHQEMGIEYGEARNFILDGTNDHGVDFIWIDDQNHEVIVGQAEYDVSWSRGPASTNKAIKTFKEFNDYLLTSKLPDKLHDQAKTLWRTAKSKSVKYKLRFVFVTPKHFSAKQEEYIRSATGLTNYDFITHDILIERGEEFLDGQTGMCNFSLKTKDVLKIPFDFGTVYLSNINVSDINEIVEIHKKSRRLRALFASNVRTYLTRKRRNKDIAEEMKRTLKMAPQEFLLCNNGITIICNNVEKADTCLNLKRASITNGCQTVMNINSFFDENPEAFPAAEVLVTIIEIPKNVTKLAGDIARSRNNQNPVDYRDLMSNNFRLVCLHHRLMADRVAGSERRYYLLRKAGEKQTLLKEQPESRGKFVWIDSAELAQCIAAVIRQNPYLSQQGISKLFGKSFNNIFPGVNDPTHSRCKYSWWLIQLIWNSYGNKTKWKGVRDYQIIYEKDFKNPAIWMVAALIDKKLKDDFQFNEIIEKRFAEKAEKWGVNKRSAGSQDFQRITYKMIDDAYRLLHSESRTLLGKKLPKADNPYGSYRDLLKGPATYDVILGELRKGKMITYQNQLHNSMKKLVEYLKNN
jgi:hypothetical protein